MGTSIVGNWDGAMAATNACRTRLLDVTGRAPISIRIDDRPGAGDLPHRKVPSAEGEMVGYSAASG
ncbi:MAG: thiamine-binding protein [Candidatus Bipolaricaulota bacterium]|nr:thiamine-binding protein [Candidatus Bipolaricaulota bacterium]